MNTESAIMKRIKSFLWRLGMAVVAFVVSWVLANLELLELSPVTTGVLALVLGEVSKYLNTPEYIRKG